jgi:hypothetical protein
LVGYWVQEQALLIIPLSSIAIPFSPFCLDIEFFARTDPRSSILDFPAYGLRHCLIFHTQPALQRPNGPAGHGVNGVPFLSISSISSSINPGVNWHRAESARKFFLAEPGL